MLLRAIDSYEGYPITQFACRIAPHVMLRPGELRHSVWSDIDWKGALWSIPAERMKMRRPHSVPLSRQVLALLRELAVHSGVSCPKRNRGGGDRGVKVGVDRPVHAWENSLRD